MVDFSTGVLNCLGLDAQDHDSKGKTNTNTETMRIKTETKTKTVTLKTKTVKILPPSWIKPKQLKLKSPNFAHR